MKKPKKKIEIVYYLIRRMSRAEKRHFKLYNQIYKGKNKDFIKLFDFLNNMKVYDTAIVEAFWEKKNIKQKNVCITYLLNRVTETIYLIRSHELLTVKNLIQPHLNSFYVYDKMELLELAYKELDKAEQIANKYEEINMLFEIYELKRHVGEITNFNEEICEPKALFIKKRYIAFRKFIHRENLIRMLAKIYTGTFDDKADEPYKELTTYGEYYNEFTVPDKMYFNVCNFYYLRRRELKKALTFLADTIELYEDNAHFIPYEIGSYFTFWHNMIISGVNSDYIDLALNYYKKYKKIPQKHKEIFDNLSINTKISYYMTAHLFEIKYVILFEKYDEIKQVIQSIKKTLKQYDTSDFRHEKFYSILLRASYCNLLIENYAESEHWLIRLLNFSYPIVQRVSDEMEILKLILIYEEDNKALLKSKVRSLDRKWKINLPISQNVLHMLELLKQTLLKRNKDKLPQVFKMSHKNALQIENNIDHYLPFSKWIALKM